MKNTARIVSVLVFFAIVLTSCAPTVTPAPPTAAPGTTLPDTAVPSTAVPTTAEKIHLVIWWWGEQEAPGAQKWMDDTVAAYELLHPNITIETVLQSTDSLIPAFTSAAAAKSGPDIQYFWGGVWTLENAWSGAIIPLDNLIPATEMSHYINNFERSYDGKQYGIGWYLSLI